MCGYWDNDIFLTQYLTVFIIYSNILQRLNCAQQEALTSNVSYNMHFEFHYEWKVWKLNILFIVLVLFYYVKIQCLLSNKLTFK